MNQLRSLTAISALLVAATGLSARADNPIRPVNERFAVPADANPAEVSIKAAIDDSGVETPDFRRHVLPLMGRLGCNGRACHGSFQGQGGFRLSLFGYDFKADHDALTTGKAPRIDSTATAKSLILEKPTLAVDHEGGKRITRGSWEYRVLHRWISAGAKPQATDVDKNEIKFERLEISPREIVFEQPGDTAQLNVVAYWSDGSKEDVTPICRFRSNDESVAKIDESGKVICIASGDTHVVTFYDNGVMPIPVMLPISEFVNDKYPQVVMPTKIDELVVAKLRKMGLVPSGLADDAEFLRRVTLDVTGTLPTAEEVTAFLADSSANKRDAKIDELIERPAYSAWWTTRLCDITGNNPRQMQNSIAPQPEEWYRWLAERVQNNTPYDKIVEGMLLGTSRKPGQSYEEFCREVSTYYGPNKSAEFTQRDSMPHYWARQNFRTPEDRVMGFAYAFMGIQIQCAQCHKHPFDQWTKQDFDEFKPLFARVRYGAAPNTKEQSDKMIADLGIVKDEKKNNNNIQKELRTALMAGKLVPIDEVYITPPNRPAQRAKGEKNAKKAPPPSQTAKVLGGEKVDLTQLDDPRQALVDWLRKDPKRYMARAFVNRVWANYFNVGIIHPTDDMNLANPPSNAALLDYLADGFVEHNYDMKWVHREICRSRTYQLSWKPNETNKLDQRNFSRAVPRRLPAEVAYDAIVSATAGNDELKTMFDMPHDRTIGLANMVGPNRGAGKSTYALTVFGKPQRLTNCDCERSAEPSLLQTIYLQNDQETLTFIERSTGFVKQTEKALLATLPKSANATKPSAAVSAPTAKQARADLAELQQRLVKLKKRDKPSDTDAEDVAKAERRIKRLQNQIAEIEKTAKAEANQADAAKVAAPNDKVTTNTPTDKSAAVLSPVVEKPVVEPAKLDEVVRQAYLRTVNRHPSSTELIRAREHLQDSATPGAGLRDLMWALVNTKEFIVNR